MPRINLSIDDELFNLLQEAADKRNCTINVHIISILEGLYKQNPFDYESTLAQLIEETKEIPINDDFTLVKLPSFADICVAKAEDAKVKPSMVRARLGKMFNAAVSTEKIKIDGTKVIRQKDEAGKLKFIARAAVYVRVKDNELSMDGEDNAN